MNELQEALMAGVMLSWLTWGTLKIVLMNFREENEQKKSL